MDIRKRLLFGLIIIGFVFCLQGVLSVMQLVQFSQSAFLDKDMARIEICRQLREETLRQNRQIVNSVINPELNLRLVSSLDDRMFTQLIDSAIHANVTGDRGLSALVSNRPTTPQLNNAVDSLMLTYSIFRSNLMVLDSLFVLTGTNRVYWYQQLYEPSSAQFIHAIDRLSMAYHKRSLENSFLLKKNFCRMIMPPILVLIAGLLLIVLFYFAIKPRSRPIAS